MTQQKFFQRIALVAASFAGIAVLATSGFANALNSGTPVPVDTPTQTIIAKGDQEIARRLSSLNKLIAAIDATTKLNASDKSTLTAEVNAEVSGLNALKTALDTSTTIAAVRSNAQSIILDYRVYALIVPKIRLIVAADGQQNVEAKLTALLNKLQTRLTDAQNAGKNVGTLNADLADMRSQIAAATSLSSSVETKVLPLQPADYNSDHTLLSGYRAELQTAHSDNVAAANDAKAIINGLKNLS